MIRRVCLPVVAVAAILVGGVGCKSKQPAVPTVDPHKLVVLSALWGVVYEDLTADVTALVRAKIRDDALSVEAKPRVFGDPAPGKLKQLRVVYRKGEMVAKKIVEEGETLTIGRDEKPVPLRLVVTKAVYGDFDGGRTVDVTLRLADMVKDNKLSVGNYNELAGDPAANTAKQLRVEYTVDGQALSKTLTEGEPLVLSVPERS